MPAIVAENLVKDYPRVRAVDRASFTVEEGEIYGFFGPNGAGKSTTMQLLTGLTRPDGGSVEVAGVDVVLDPEVVRDHVAIFPEIIRPYEQMAGRDYLRFHGRMMGLDRSEREQRIDRLVPFLEMEPFMDQEIGTMSMGQRRRTDLARVFMSGAEILFLDEPFNSIDTQARRRIREYLRDLVDAGRTIFYTSHNLIESEHVVDRYAFIIDGAIAATGTAEDLRDRHLGKRLSLDVGDLAKAAGHLDGLDLVAAARVDDGRLQVTMSGGADEADLVRNLVEAGFAVRAVEPEGTMEDVFDHLTAEEGS